MANDSRLGILIEAKANTSGAFNQAIGDISRLEQTANGVAAAIAGIFAFQGIGQIVELGQSAVELSTFAAGVDRTKASLDDLASKSGETGDAMLAGLRSASQGMIKDSELILAANRAMLLGVASNTDQLAQLLDVARVRGQAMGLSVGQAFSDLVTGIGRASPMILDNLGIVTGGEATFQAYAESIGKSSDALTDAERKQALFNKVVSESAGLMAATAGPADDAAAAVDRAAAAWERFQIALGRQIAPVVAGTLDTATGFIESDIAGMQAIFDSVDTSQIQGQINGLENMLAHLKEGKDQLLSDQASGSPFFNPADLDRQNSLIAEAEKQLAQYKLQLELATQGATTAASSLQPYEAEMLRLKTAQAEAAKGADDLSKSLQSVDKAGASATGGIANQLAGLTLEGLINPDEASDAYVEAIKRIERETEVLKQRFADGKISAEEFALQLAFVGKYSAQHVSEMGEAASATQEFNQTLQNSPAGFQAFIQAALASGVPIEELIGLVQGLKSELAGLAGARNAAVSGLANQLASQVEQGLLTQADASRIYAEGVTKADKAQSELSASLAESGKATDEFVFAQALAFNTVDDGAEAIAEADRQAKQYASTLQSEAKSAANEAAQAFDNLKSKVSSVISGALDPGVGVDVESLLPHEDAINENAKRLADIAVNGFKGQDWLGQFAEAVPDIYKLLVNSGDPKTEAARLLKDFQDGLVPELIDKDKAKERVKRMLLGEQNVAQMAQEIATELAAELGTAAPEDLKQKVNAALGVDGGTTGASVTVDSVTVAPTAFAGLPATSLTVDAVSIAPEVLSAALSQATAITIDTINIAPAALDALSGTGEGAAQFFNLGFLSAITDGVAGIAQTINTAMGTDENLAKMKTAGQNAGQQFARGFIDFFGGNVPQAIIDALANLITPVVQANLKQQASLTGAK